MANVAVVGFTCPTCSAAVTKYIEDDDGVFFLPEAWCGACSPPVKMTKSLKKVVTSGELNAAKAEAVENENVETYLP